MDKRILIPAGMLIVTLGGAGLYFASSDTSSGTPATRIEVSAVMPKRTPVEMVRNSSGVIVGTVSDVRVAKVPSEDRKGKDDIVTIATVDVEKYLYNPKKADSKIVNIESLGGSIDGLSMSAEDAATFAVGERVLVFLDKKDDTTYTVYGWAQGKYTIGADGFVGAGKERIYLRDLFGSETIEASLLESRIESIAAGTDS